jgi:hypothetical protein
VTILASLFDEQADWCDRLGSLFTASLLRACAQDIEAAGPIAEVMGDRAWRRPDAAPLRLAGALHAAVLTGRDAALAQEYPPARVDWDIACVMEGVRALVARDSAFFRAFLQSPPQTNETRRALALLPAFLSVGAKVQPLHTLELGASAGLNLSWDKFAFRTPNWSWGSSQTDAPLIDTEWRGAAPAWLGPLNVATRAGCDLNPVDVRDGNQRTRLRAYVWPDQPDRMARLDRAAELAIREDVRVARADAGEWLEEKLAGEPPEGATIIYHSIVWQYFAKETRGRARAAIEAAGARAGKKRRVAWVRFEHERVFGGDEDAYIVDLVEWPGGERRRIATVDPHVRWVEI